MALFSLVLSLFPIFRHRQGHLGDELARVLVLGRAFQIVVERFPTFHHYY